MSVSAFPPRLPLTRRTMLGLVALGGFGSLGILSACGKADPAGNPDAGLQIIAPKGRPVSVNPSDPAQAGKAMTALGLGLWKALTPAMGTGNAVFSPYSIMSALGMTQFGATDQLKAKMDRAMGADATAIAGDLAAVNGAVQQAISQGAPEPNTDQQPLIFSPANRLFVQTAFALVDDFVARVKGGYGVDLAGVDYKQDPAGAQQVINTWVKGQTHDLIPKLIADGIIDDSWRLTLVNALYLKAPWETEMESSGTLPFTQLDGTTSDIEPMRSTQTMGHVSGDGWESATIAYRGGGLAMTLVIPDKGKFADVRAGFTPDLYAKAVSSQRDLGVLIMPKFSIDWSQELKSALAAMGFDIFRQAFRGMSTEEDLEIATVIHQAVIKVNEQGTEAAAATAVGMRASGAPAPPDLTVTVDRPFFFVLHDTVTKAPLFIGQCTDPKA